jgi:Holliday junction resolvase RusA-like endonuclease
MNENQDNIILTLPLAVFLPRKTKPPRKYILNLNSWLHWNRFTYNAVKHAYCDALEQQLSGLTLKPPIALRFTLYRANKRLGDRANVLAVQEKMVCDALTHYGCIPDDNDDFIASSHYLTGPISRENPRVELEIINNISE